MIRVPTIRTIVGLNLLELALDDVRLPSAGRPAGRTWPHVDVGVDVCVACQVASGNDPEGFSKGRDQKNEPEAIGDEPGCQQESAGDQQAQPVEQFLGWQHPFVHLLARAHQRGEPLGAQHRHADDGGQDADRHRRQGPDLAADFDEDPDLDQGYDDESGEEDDTHTCSLLVIYLFNLNDGCIFFDDVREDGQHCDMSDGIPFIDIIILLAVAAFLILKLRSVLGKRSGHEKRPEYDPFNSKRDAPGEDKVIHLPNRNKSGEEGAAGTETRTARTESEMPGNGDGIPGLTQIKLADANFDETQFLGGARAAFEMIIQAFAMGERGSLKPLLADDVYDNFSTAIDEREERHEKLETTLVGIKEAEIIDATLENKIALVTVKFVSEQINVTRDRAGGVAEGDPSHVARITDLWTFARNVRSRDPNWNLVATESPT